MYSFPVGVAWSFFNVALHCLSLGLLIFLHTNTNNEIKQVLEKFDTNNEKSAEGGPSLSSDTIIALRSMKKKMDLIGPMSPTMLPFSFFLLGFGLFGFWPMLQRKMAYFLLSYFSYMAFAHLIMCHLTAPTMDEMHQSETNPDFKRKVLEVICKELSLKILLTLFASSSSP